MTELVADALEGATKLANVQEHRDTARNSKEAILKKESSISEEIDEAQYALHRTEEKMIHMRKQSKVKMDAAQEALALSRRNYLKQKMNTWTVWHVPMRASWKSRPWKRQWNWNGKQKTQEEIKAVISEYKATERAALEQNATLLSAIGAN